MSEDVLQLAERLFKAIESGDVDTVAKIYSTDVLIWHNYDHGEDRSYGQTREENLEVLKGLPARISGATYDVVYRERTETGFVQQHVLRGSMPNGEPFVLPACIICRVEGDEITRLDEYFDPAITSELYRVVQEAEQG